MAKDNRLTRFTQKIGVGYWSLVVTQHRHPGLDPGSTNLRTLRQWRPATATDGGSAGFAGAKTGQQRRASQEK
ncbi:hypothetical protein [Solemya elarraichensis gill symbiont]|uniref:hypothetical protein n=1 Tax=Solemya elarraichensis gill symbiont TaxID=1918949 RepID=UPI001083653B|nr:hypothetical protein [Solemya elarraichensis gill symbiont]